MPSSIDFRRASASVTRRTPSKTALLTVTVEPPRLNFETSRRTMATEGSSSVPRTANPCFWHLSRSQRVCCSAVTCPQTFPRAPSLFSAGMTLRTGLAASLNLQVCPFSIRERNLS